MSAQDALRETWTIRRWICYVAIVFLVQLGALLLLGRSVQTTSVDRKPAPVLIPASQAAELAALENPTLFALPNRHGFSAAAWLNTPAATHQSSDWVEPSYWLPLRDPELGRAFRERIDFHAPSQRFAKKIEPEYALLRLHLSGQDMSSRSTFRIEGPLTERQLLSAFDLMSQPAANLLTNSVVKLLVDAAGFVRTATLLANSGSALADQQAMALSKAARFVPIPLSQAGGMDGSMTRGYIIFEWRTVPPASTNAPSLNPLN